MFTCDTLKIVSVSCAMCLARSCYLAFGILASTDWVQVVCRIDI